MSIAAGQRLGRYEIRSLLGVGGMGEVYLALDTQLERMVALKVLPPQVASDAERMRRFTQEAKSAAALNHPSIAHIYEIGEAAGTYFIAMEYIDGTTLRDRIYRDKTPLPKLLRDLQQAAEALARAHGAGVIHRDLKPDNIMVTRDGLAKVLDFGLAKLVQPFGPKGSDGSQLSVATAAVPQESAPGLILGTIGYMSPEQAEGKTQQIDHRSDVFSFGCLLYEAATGHKPFHADSIIKSLHKIVYEHAPPIKELNPAAPADLQRIVRRCLAKDPEERYQSIKDLAIELKELRRELESTAHSDATAPLSAHDHDAGTSDAATEYSSGSAAGSKAFSTDRPTSSAEYIVTEIRRHKRGAAVVLCLVLVAAGGLAFAWHRLGGSTPKAATGPAPRVVPFTSFRGVEHWPAFSPDGNQLAFSWNGEREDNPDIYVQLVGAGTPLRLTTNPGSDTAPAFSPDGRFIAFIRESLERSALYLVPSLGGPERKLLDMFPRVTGRAAYSPDGKFLAISNKDSAEDSFALHLLPLGTGERRKLTTPPAGALGDASPALSPDGEWIAFTRTLSIGVSDLYVMPAAGGDVKRLTFDNVTMGLGTGLAGSVAWTGDGREIVFASSRGGSLSHLWRVAASGGEPVRVDRVGALAATPVVSPRGDRLAYTQLFNDLNIWRLPTGERDEPDAPTLLISSTLMDDSPSYSPDGRRIAFVSSRSGSYEIWVCDADGSNAVQLTQFGGPVTGTPRWSPDAKWIAFDTRVEGNPDIFVVSAEGGQPRRLTTEASEDIVPSWSRDGRFLYFSSTRTGSLQVWKMPAEGGKAQQITRRGGFEGYESADGDFFYYQKTRNPTVPGIWRVPVEGGEETLVFDQQGAGLWRSWTITREGIYFVGGEPPRHGVIGFYSFSDRKISEVFRPHRDIFTGFLGLSVSPDGKSLLYTQADQVGRDIMLVENFR